MAAEEGTGVVNGVGGRGWKVERRENVKKRGRRQSYL